MDDDPALPGGADAVDLPRVNGPYLHNVPDVVVERFERLAALDGTSVGAVAVRELANVSKRADSPALLGTLPDLGVDAGCVVVDLDAARAER